MKRFDMSKFYFEVASFDKYDVTYTTGHGDYYTSLVEYSNPIIDVTKNSMSPKKKDITMLKNLIKRTGKHFHKNGNRF